MDFSGRAWDPSWGLLLSGGYREGTDQLDSFVSTEDGVRMNEMTPLPITLSSHCAVAVDENSVIVLGGVPDGTNAFKYDKIDE